MRNFEKLVHGWCFGIYHIVIFEQFPIVWLSWDNSKNNSYHFIFKPTYFTPFLIIISYPNNDFILPPPTHQVTNMDMKKQINMCIFIVHGIYINSNQIKFEISIMMNHWNRTWKHKKRKKIMDCH